MISIDRTWFGTAYSGDVCDRHREYVKHFDGELDIIVLTKKGFSQKSFGKDLNIYPTNSLSKLSYVSDAFNVAKNVYQSHNFDLIVTQDPFLCGLAGWLIKKKNSVPLLVHFHGDFWKNRRWLFEKKRWWFNWFFLLISKFVVRRATGIRVVSSGIKDKLVKSGIGASKVRVIPTPVNVEKFNTCNIEKVASIKETVKGKDILINVGRNDPSKDYPMLFKALNLVCRNREVVFVQAGNEAMSNSRLEKKGNLYLLGLGNVSQEELINYYHASTVYVSSSCHESLGKVLIEAMACGVPVVATATTGSKDIVVNGENGFLVSVGDYKALAEKVTFLLDHPQKAEAMGSKSRNMVVRKFDRDRTIDMVVCFWRDLISKKA